MTRMTLTTLVAASLALGAGAAIADTTTANTTTANTTTATAPAAAPATPADVPQDDNLNATLWMQNSVEHKAVAMGLFDLARMRLHQALSHKGWTAVPDMEGSGYEKKPVAIITDLDETVLDNANYEASLVTRHTSFSPKEWTDYVNSKTSKAMPGAIAFLKYAEKHGVHIFYVSNRNKAEEPATRENMKALGFPVDAKKTDFLSKGDKPEWGSSKGSRIAYVAKDYRVVLLMGDNMGDFTDKAKGDAKARMKAFEADHKHWGHDWIVFPNPEYGSWESAAFDNDWKKPADQRRKEKIEALHPWSPKG
ncbi:5'-nucleotidase, lipoprotein e(P4) family [Acidimangrovimonas sediminis]|uniref:5'-nucleotidase, lipoprotein e(P4) family n=1 Tax=Acidimangrovimonas sediminis TaxID=2056283 RepID=UPI001304DA17|nr:5'-nucleotidase, lipoprotein e(P4) family [Acidimangrovimonas sediminis]